VRELLLLGGLAEAGASGAQGGLEHDLDGLRCDRVGEFREDPELGALLFVGQLVPPRKSIELAHVHVSGRRLRKLIADRTEKVETIRDDPRCIPELASSDLQDRFARAARARREVPPAGVRRAHPDSEVSVEGKDHGDLGGGGRELLEARVSARYEGQIRHWRKSKQDSDRRVNSPRGTEGGGMVLAVRRAALRPADRGPRR